MIAITLILLYSLTINAEYIPPGPKYRCPKESLLLHPCKCDTETDVGITVVCRNTNLASMSVGLNNLATFQLPIEKLTLYKCNIAKLYGSLLYKLQLRILHIEDTPIEVIEEHTFLGVNVTLNELYILNSSLIEFPKLAFKILGNLTILKIDGHRISSLPTDSFAESDLSGKLLHFHMSKGNLSTLPVGALQPLRKLKTLDLHSNQIKELKRNQFKGLRDTEVLDLSYNSILKIDSSHLGDLIKLGWCNVSHNGITELTRGAFARNSLLKVLNMSHNKIKRLDSNSFRGMRFLRRLYLSDNMIKDVGRGTFNSVTRIGTIDLARNFIKKIDYQMFFQLNFIEIIDVSENNVTEIQKLAFKDVYFTNIDLSKNQIDKIETGAFENCANITLLDLSYNKLKSIPKRAFDETTYATELQLSYNNFMEMAQIPLHNMTGLKILNVSHNEIINITKNTFPKLYELHTIDVSHNNLSSIYNSVFQVLFSLRFLDLSYNKMDTIKPSTFGALPTLLEMDLSNNELSNIAKSAFTRIASMRKLNVRNNNLRSIFILPISVSHLDLSYNEFEEIPQKLWPSMNSLLTLDLSHNRIRDNLSKGSFQGLLTLQKLNLNYNEISKPPYEALSDFTSLQYIYLEGNNITKLAKGAFGRLPVVFELNLAHNQISNISVKAFEGLLQMLVLNMTNNNLTYIPNGAFQGLVALKTLDLSFNRLEKIENKTHGLLDDLLSIEQVNLSHNKISFITRKTFPNDPYIPYKLKNIDLSFNNMPVLTYDIVFGTSKVEKLNVSSNGIIDIRKHVIGNITRLKVLDLSHNKLNDLVSDREKFRLPLNISEIYLSDNHLGDLPWNHLKNLHIDVLDVRDNKFDGIGPDLTDMAIKGTSVYFEGNPLNCDCFLRPLKRYFSSQLFLQPFYKDIKCASPPYLNNRSLHEIPEDRLNCPSNVNTTRIIESNPGDYGVTPDLRFREFKLQDNRLKLKWRINKNEDIADPYVIIRDVKDQKELVYETTLPYFKRTLEIDKNLTKLLQNGKMEYQICILALDSKASIRRLYKDQCKEISESGSTILKTNVIFSVVFVYILKYLD